jgi:hypothetical protein
MKVPAIEVVSSEHCPDDRAYLVAGSVSAAGALELKRRVAAGEIQALAWIEIMAREQRLSAVVNAQPSHPDKTGQSR